MGTPQPPEMTVREPLLALTDRYNGPSAEQVLARLQEPDMQTIKGVVSWRGAFLTDDACPVELGLAYLRLLQQESCGRCGPCRIGVDIMIEQIEKLVAGKADTVGGEDPVARIRRLAESIDDSAWCGIANTIGPPIVALLDLAPEHFAAHAAGNTCEPSTKHGWVTAPCRSTCPSTLDIPWYIFHGLEEHPHLATRIVKRDNPLPAIIGRTCPHPCEGNCSLAPIGQPIAINNIKRWCADRAEDLATDHCASGCLVDPTKGAALEAKADGGALADTAALIEGGPHEISELVTAQPGHWPLGSSMAASAATAAGGNGNGAGAEGAAVRRGAPAAPRPARRSPSSAPDRPASPPVTTWPAWATLRPSSKTCRCRAAWCTWASPSIGCRAMSSAARRSSSSSKGSRSATTPGWAATSSSPIWRRTGSKPPSWPSALTSGGRSASRERTFLVPWTPSSSCARWRWARRSTSATACWCWEAATPPWTRPAPPSVLGAKRVQVVYRRTRNEMPANAWEIEEAEEEGVEFLYLAAPVECQGVEGVEGLVCQQMELGEPDASGRRRPVPTDMAPFVLTASSIIYAVGQQPDFDPFKGDDAIKLNKWGYMEVDPYTLQTTKPGVFVGGDAVSGGGTIIEAINAGKVAAKYIDKYLRGEPVEEDLEDKTKRLAVYLGAQDSREPLADNVDYGTREKMPMVDPEVRKHNFEATELGYTLEQCKSEADRCLRCHRPILVAV